MNYKYDIAISFAGEDRNYASELASLLQEMSVNVFYDEFEQAKLWGKDLYEYLSQIYSRESRYCVMFLSKHYAAKAWTTHERKNAQERAFKENKEYILPVKIDDTEIPGIPTTIGYMDIRHSTIEEIANMVLQKLGIKKEVDIAKDDDYDEDVILPNIKKEFTEYDKDQFLKETYNIIKNYFDKSLKAVNKKYSEVDVDFEEITKHKFVAKIYVNGNQINQCKIWIGGSFSGKSISYAEGDFDVHRDNSLNDSINVESDEMNLFLKPLGTDFFSNYAKPEKANPKQAAEYFWSKFIQRLSH